MKYSWSPNKERFIFRPGEVIHSERKWTYEVFPYGVRKQLTIAEVDAGVPGLVGLTVFGDWGMDIICSKKPWIIKINGMERPMKLAESGHPQVDLFTDGPDFYAGRAVTRRPGYRMANRPMHSQRMPPHPILMQHRHW